MENVALQSKITRKEVAGSEKNIAGSSHENSKNVTLQCVHEKECFLGNLFDYIKATPPPINVDFAALRSHYSKSDDW
jgi:hypothetical protein